MPCRWFFVFSPEKIRAITPARAAVIGDFLCRICAATDGCGAVAESKQHKIMRCAEVPVAVGLFGICVFAAMQEPALFIFPSE